MYRLSCEKDDRLQKIVSKEIANGFHQIFGIENGDSDLQSVLEFCSYAGWEADMDDIRTVAAYIMALYSEITDPDAEYTFDLQGEYILYEATAMAMELYGGYFMTDMQHLESVTRSWKSSASSEDMAYIVQQSFNRGAEFLNDDVSDSFSIVEACSDVADYAETFALQCTYFPCMTAELDSDGGMELLYWDIDFMLIDGYDEAYFRHFAKTGRTGSDRYLLDHEFY